MDQLVNPKAYPHPLPQEIAGLGAYGVDVANRWMLGWPGRVKSLIAKGDYLAVLKETVEREMKVLTGPDAPTHLARHEIVQMYDLPVEPPTS